MRVEISAIFASRKVELRQTPRAVTPFGGLAVFVDLLKRVGWTEQVRGAILFELRSPTAIPAAETLTAFVISVMVGARRFGYANEFDDILSTRPSRDQGRHFSGVVLVVRTKHRS